jgi:hypothetical protein
VLEAATIRRTERPRAGKPVASSAGTRTNQAAPPPIGVANDKEVIMTTQTNHPSKEVVREYLERRNQEALPPPTPEEIRRQLGWGLVMFDEQTDHRT